METFKIIGDGKTQQILVYLGIASKMNFSEAETNLVNQISESFVITNMRPEFSSLDRKTKILVARKRLWYMMNGWDEGFGDAKHKFLNNKSAGLMSILIDYNQKTIKFHYNTEECKERIKYSVREAKIANT